MSNAISAKLTKMMEHHEGFRARPYHDSMGRWTVGFGYCLETGPALSKSLWYAVLLECLVHAEEWVAQVYPEYSRLSDARQAVLISMAYNLGRGGLAGFRKMLAAIKADDYAEAARQMLDSNWAVQVGNRAHELASMMRTGEWANES